MDTVVYCPQCAKLGLQNILQVYPCSDSNVAYLCSNLDCTYPLEVSDQWILSTSQDQQKSAIISPDNLTSSLQITKCNSSEIVDLNFVFDGSDAVDSQSNLDLFDSLDGPVDSLPSSIHDASTMPSTCLSTSRSQCNVGTVSDKFSSCSEFSIESQQSMLATPKTQNLGGPSDVIQTLFFSWLGYGKINMYVSLVHHILIFCPAFQQFFQNDSNVCQLQHRYSKCIEEINEYPVNEIEPSPLLSYFLKVRPYLQPLISLISQFITKPSDMNIASLLTVYMDSVAKRFPSIDFISRFQVSYTKDICCVSSKCGSGVCIQQSDMKIVFSGCLSSNFNLEQNPVSYTKCLKCPSSRRNRIQWHTLPSCLIVSLNCPVPPDVDVDSTFSIPSAGLFPTVLVEISGKRTILWVRHPDNKSIDVQLYQSHGLHYLPWVDYWLCMKSPSLELVKFSKMDMTTNSLPNLKLVILERQCNRSSSTFPFATHLANCAPQKTTPEDLPRPSPKTSTPPPPQAQKSRSSCTSVSEELTSSASQCDESVVPSIPGQSNYMLSRYLANQIPRDPIRSWHPSAKVQARSYLEDLCRDQGMDSSSTVSIATSVRTNSTEDSTGTKRSLSINDLIKAKINSLKKPRL